MHIEILKNRIRTYFEKPDPQLWLGENIKLDNVQKHKKNFVSEFCVERYRYIPAIIIMMIYSL